MTEKDKIKYISFMALRDELENVSVTGTRLLLDGQPQAPEGIARACVFNESSAYMRDYVRDENGQLVRLEFDRVDG